MKNFLVISTLLLLPSFANAQSNIEVIPVKDNLHMLVSPQGGNVTVSTGENGTFIIDDQLTGRSEIIEKAAQEINNTKIKFVLNTHYHFDHSGGNEFFGNNGAIIVAHDNVHKRLSTRQFITYFKKEMPAMAKAGLPVVTFAQDMSLHYNGDDIRIIHMPNAHTDGDAAALFTNANVLVAGDVIFNGIYPFIDTEHGGSINGIIAALDVFLKLADAKTVIIPGHGKLMSKSEVQQYRNMLATIRDKIQTSIKAGKTLEQTIAEKPTQEFDKKVSTGFISPETFVTVLYNDLSR